MSGKKARQEAPTAQRHSFVVRTWQESGLPTWRGRVQHTCTGDAVLFRDLDELLAFIEERTGGWAGGSLLGSELRRDGIGLS